MADGAQASNRAQQAAPKADRAATGDGGQFAGMMLMLELMRTAQESATAAMTRLGGGTLPGGTSSTQVGGGQPGAISTVPLEALANHVALQAQSMREQRKALRIELDPENLGHLVVEFERRGNGLSIRLEAESENAARALERTRPALLERLTGLGFATVDVVIETDPGEIPPGTEGRVGATSSANFAMREVCEG